MGNDLSPYDDWGVLDRASIPTGDSDDHIVSRQSGFLWLKGSRTRVEMASGQTQGVHPCALHAVLRQHKRVSMTMAIAGLRALRNADVVEVSLP